MLYHRYRPDTSHILLISFLSQGIWILYDKTNYNGASVSSSNWWLWGEDYCTNVPNSFLNSASSARFTGAPDDWKYDTINFYADLNFTGDEWFTYGDKVTFDKF